MSTLLTPTPEPGVYMGHPEVRNGMEMWGTGKEEGQMRESTWVSSLAVQALPWGTAHSPVPIDEETVAHRVAEPLHGQRH